jgi:hypothetical protein
VPVELAQLLVSFDGCTQGVIVTEFISLVTQSLCFLGDVVDPLIFVGAVRRKHGSRIREVLGGLAIP